MIRINVSEELKDKIVTREHGRRLFELVSAGLSNPPVIVDFDGLQVTSVSFFDEAFSHLAVRLGHDGFAEKVKFENIDPFDLALVNDIVLSRPRQARKRAS